MAAENTPDEPHTPARDPKHVDKVASEGKESVEHDSDDDDDDDDVDEEPKLKYSRLTRDLGPYTGMATRQLPSWSLGTRWYGHSSMLHVHEPCKLSTEC